MVQESEYKKMKDSFEPGTDELDYESSPEEEVLDNYELKLHKMLVNIKVSMKETDFVPSYIISLTNISTTTKIILEKIREEFISSTGASNFELETKNSKGAVKEQFVKEISFLLNKYFPNASKETKDMLISYLIEQNLGLGHLEILLNDESLEEIVVNNAKDPVWVYHRKHGWLKTNIILLKENKIRHYATMIGRDVNKEITLLHPLLDAHLLSGDRVNATLTPISTKGNTITIRKFSKDPWTITKFLKAGTIDYYTASVVWQLIQNELSIIIAGGTGSGKTSMLNVISNFFPPNQRIISIEDTRELTLPENLHWVPMETRLANPEGKGGISMLDLLVNSLRMRPDRIAVGEIRRKEEAQVLLEAMHTGHSVYGTFHANTAEEAMVRLTNDPINIAKATLSSLGAFLVQNRDRRSGKRRVLQLAEINQEGDPHVFVRYDAKKDIQYKSEDQKRIYETLNVYTGMTPEEIENDLKEKVIILKWLVKNNIEDINQIGIVMAKYYRGNLFS
jgi:flagellar protein FlaI